jgi:glycine cleavage system aminomethyltransferase T
VQGIASGINSAISMINRVINGANKLPNVNIPLIPEVAIPEFAEGGMVTGPTLGLVGEAGPEYIVPARKAKAFAQNILAGVRGPGAIPRFAEGGYVAPASVNIQTGPVTQMDGTNFVTTQDLSRAVQSGVNQTLDLIRRDSSIRTSLGMI